MNYSTTAGSAISGCIINATCCHDDSYDVYIGEAIAKKKEKLPENAKTLICSSANGKMMNIKIADTDGYVACEKAIMPEILNVEVVERKYKSQVIVTFADDTTETATLSYNDQFDLEQGISVCVTKKLLSDKIGAGYGGSTYNKIVDRGLKVYIKCEKAKAKKEAEEASKRRKYEKTIAKKKARRMKRETEEREKQIEIQKEAILRAMHEFHTRSAD